MSDRRDFYRDKTVLITGASSGIGAELARVLVPAGARIGLAARRRDRLEALAAEIAAAGGTAMVLPCDVTDRAACRSTLDAFETAYGATDVAILNAGGQGEMGLGEFSYERVKAIFDLNFFGVLHFMDVLVPRMIERGHGHLAATSSLARDRGLLGRGAYSASKSALSVLLEALRSETPGTGLVLTTIEPGFVKSELTAAKKHRLPFLVETRVAAETILDAIASGRPVVRFPWQLSATSALARLLPPGLYGALSRRVVPSVARLPQGSN